jgi:hypothetical protein
MTWGSIHEEFSGYLPDEKLIELARQIAPVVYGKNGELREVIGWIENTRGDFFGSREGDRKKVRKRFPFLSKEITSGVYIQFLGCPLLGKVRRDLEELIRIPTSHAYSSDWFFRGTIANVLSQIPSEYIPQTTAFRFGNIDFSNKYYDHIAETILYRNAIKK